MSATNRTANYNLPQFVATDVPTWLTDVNGAMSTIDTSIKGVADSVTTVHGEVNAVDARVDTTNGNITTLAQSVTTAEQNIATLQQGLGVANSNITANTTKIGNATLETSAQDLSNAVNELHEDVTVTNHISDFTLASGWRLISDEPSELFKIGNVSFLDFQVAPTNGNMSVGFNTAGTLPESYRPAQTVLFPCFVYGSGFAPKAYTAVRVNPNGNVEIYCYGSALSGIVRCVFSGSFIE